MSWSSATHLARTGINCDPGGAVTAPVHLTSAWRREEAGTAGAFDYARTANPGRALLEEAIAKLEGAAGACVTASGMAAIDLLLNDLPAGSRIVCGHDVYGGTRRLLDARAEGRRFTINYVDLTNVAAAQEALSRPAALVFIETPSNPRLRITDIAAVCALTREAGAVSVVDNTVLTGAQQRPLDLGADIVVGSATKLLNGHSDMVGGFVAARDATRMERFAWWVNAAGVGGGAFDAFLATRGLRTLALRAKAQSASALDLAIRLDAHPSVTRVDYPGLTAHKGHALAAEQQSGFGPLISMELVGGLCPNAFVQDLDLFTLAQSLGGTESLVSIPSLMTHAAMSPADRAQAGIADGLVRLSVGLEDVEDLWRDLSDALERSSTRSA
ncbi:trans-sulfuration enzyme family protein [Hyphobacterium marinum]|uniref:PLP-dependent aspartate aminotransferase family protein n=1 Tax=Hyphobacterium marinum TaxID=3116574 RepID=A0ABU7LW33_9PROT|nr:PLP-dependent aspartate aminotransferase family protein [Hyphobacterium sp. Y6023]MEE2565778.1 PLP-dependent aspartate aminotransferase family protein [Hyphobacterium sp. Y6023]